MRRARFGALPPGIEADVWDGGDDLPDSADQVEYVVLPLGVKPETVRKIATLPSLKIVQLLSAGADHVLPYLPGHITLCNARGAHTAATAELTVGLIVASLRELPPVRGRAARRPLGPGAEPLIAGKRVLIVGYGDIGAAVERRLAGWEVTVDRVARRARDGVHPIDELPRLLPDADVVVMLRAGHRARPGHLVNAEFLGNMKDGALLVNAARGVIVDTGALLAELLERQDQGRARRRPTPSRSRTATRSGRPPGCCSPRTWAAPSTRPSTAPTGWSASSWRGSPTASRC